MKDAMHPSNVTVQREDEVHAPPNNVSISLQKLTNQLTNLDKVTILSESLPYIQKFRGKTIVVKQVIVLHSQGFISQTDHAILVI